MYDTITRIKDGYIWEEGGAFCDNGFATIISDKNGGKKTPIYIDETPCKTQVAKFKLENGDAVIRLTRWRENLYIVILKYGIIPDFGEYTEVLAEFKDKKWSCQYYASKYKDAIEAAIKKSYTTEKKIHYAKNWAIAQ